MVGHEWHQRNLSGPLDSGAQGALMFGTDSGAAAGLNLCSFGHETPNLINLFVVNMGNFFDAESADLAPAHKSATGTAAGSAGSAGSSASAWSASTASAKSRWRSAGSSRGFCRHSSSSPFFQLPI